MILLLDIGNTRCKWALCESLSPDLPEIVSSGVVSEFSKIPFCYTELKQVAYASVSSQKFTKKILNDLAGYTDVPVVKADTVTSVSLLEHCYGKPERLGVDRWLVMLGALALSKYKRVCVADLGTAFTLDLAINDKHIGGVIAPGYELMRDSLLNDTANIGNADDSYSGLIGVSTGEGVAAGCQNALNAQLEFYRNSISVDYPRCEYFVTGGGAAKLPEKIRQHWRFEPDLVLCGLAVWLKYAQR